MFTPVCPTAELQVGSMTRRTLLGLWPAIGWVPVDVPSKLPWSNPRSVGMFASHRHTPSCFICFNPIIYIHIYIYTYIYILSAYSYHISMSSFFQTILYSCSLWRLRLSSPDWVSSYQTQRSYLVVFSDVYPQENPHNTP